VVTCKIKHFTTFLRPRHSRRKSTALKHFSNRFRDMAIENYARLLRAVILKIVQLEVETFNPPTRKPCHRTKRKVNCMTRCRNSTFSKMPAAILDFLKPQVSSLDPPTSKTLYPRTKHEVDRMTPCRDMAVQNFPNCEVGRSVGRSVVGPQYYIVLMYSSSLR